MRIVIQCAARKQSSAGCLRDDSGRPVRFVAHPSLVGSGHGGVYAHPDDLRADGRSWRRFLLDYNAQPTGNPLALLEAHRLYAHAAYAKLASRIGPENLFILSAGWGLLSSSFLTPDYDITFSGSAGPAQRRHRTDRFDDLNLLPQGSDEPVAFFGGKDYLPLFVALTDRWAGRRVVVHNSQTRPTFEGIECVKFETPAKTNWHYLAAAAFLREEFDPFA